MIGTYRDIEAHANRGLAAADLMLANGFHNQAVGRAYYAVYVSVSFTANHTPVFAWPIWPQAMTAAAGQKQGRLQHRWMHDYAEALYQMGGTPPIRLDKAPSPRHAVKELYQQRITADYLTANEIGRRFAQRLVRNAKELVRVFLIEAQRVQGNPVHVVK